MARHDVARHVAARLRTALRCTRQARVVTNLEHLNVADAGEGGEAAPMAELQHNLRLLVDLAEADLQRLDARLRQEKVRLLPRAACLPTMPGDGLARRAPVMGVRCGASARCRCPVHCILV